MVNIPYEEMCKQTKKSVTRDNSRGSLWVDKGAISLNQRAERGQTNKVSNYNIIPTVEQKNVKKRDSSKSAKRQASSDEADKENPHDRFKFKNDNLNAFIDQKMKDLEQEQLNSIENVFDRNSLVSEIQNEKVSALLNSFNNSISQGSSFDSKETISVGFSEDHTLDKSKGNIFDGIDFDQLANRQD